MVKNHLSRLLGERRINQTDFSKMTGIRRQTINELYHEINLSITIENLDKICCALECDVCDLFEYIPNKKNK